MKKFDIFKTVQLIFFIVLAGIGLYVIFTDKELYQQIARNPHIRLLCILLWVVLALFIWKHHDWKKQERDMEDQIAGNFADDAVPMNGE